MILPHRANPRGCDFRERHPCHNGMIFMATTKRREVAESVFGRAPHRLWLRGSDRALLVWMTWRWSSLLGMSRIVQPDTILRWHRAGFRAYWRWKSRGQLGRPKIDR